MEKISIGEARSRFSELISRTSAGERFSILRRDHPLAVLISATEFEQLERTAKMTLQLARALGQSDDILHDIEAGRAHPLAAALGLWSDSAELDQVSHEIKRNRRRRPSRRRCRYKNPRQRSLHCGPAQPA
jgi:prevent-host-death family protein